MKGQHLAVETTITFAMGLTIALGVVSVFTQYKADIQDSVKAEESLNIASKVENAIFELEKTDSGQKTLDLPDTVGGSDYSVALTDRIKVLTPTSNYSKKIYVDQNFEGLADGGTVSLYKTPNKYILRSE